MTNLTTYLGWIVPWESEVVLLAEERGGDQPRLGGSSPTSAGTSSRAGRLGRRSTGGADHESRSGRDRSRLLPCGELLGAAPRPGRTDAGPGPTSPRRPAPARVGGRPYSRRPPRATPRARRAEVHSAGRGPRSGCTAAPASAPRWRPRCSRAGERSPVLVDDMWVNAAEAGLPIVTGDDRIDP